jgi:ATP-dependent DNA helicase PIF1
MAAALNPNARDSNDDWTDLGKRDIDNVDWANYIQESELHGIISKDYWSQQKTLHPTTMQVQDMSQGAADTLNEAQRTIYDYITSHYHYELKNGIGSGGQLLMHVDGSAGTGKSYLIDVLSSHVKDIAVTHNRLEPMVRCAPTGVAAFNINGKTIHSLFRIILRQRDDATLADGRLRDMQTELRSVRYIIIDEKSMLSLHMITAIDKRCRAALPENKNIPFAGLNVVICGDFAQLPPVG